ncbi:unnamed protein product [Allacma fusca]|uniref:Uncharacterized protein n=2 Tax=Allacma fusca TaxID=39272 RepID=A0A8J2PV03_9HEXA|nr:unnamed protein product [Allacma fusca]
MIAKTLALFALVAAAQAGVVFDSHVGAQSEQNIRSLGYGGIQTLSTQSKAVDSAYSSVRRHETRVHNPAVQAVAAQVAYASPAYAQVAAPAVSYAAAPAVSYAAAPAIARVAAPAYAQVAAPAYARVAAPVAAHGLLGVAYSAVPDVAHLTFDGLGAHYAY